MANWKRSWQVKLKDLDKEYSRIPDSKATLQRLDNVIKNLDSITEKAKRCSEDSFKELNKGENQCQKN